MNGMEHATLGLLILTTLIVGPVLFYVYRARQGAELYVRRIRAIDAIEEAVGRAAELGRPIAFSNGITPVGPVLYACLGVLYHVTRKAARYAANIIAPQNDSQVLAIVEDTMREAYRDEGRSSLFDARNVPFLSDDQFAFAAGYMGLVQRERVGSAYLFGNFAAESLILAEAGQQVGAMQIAATINPEQVPFFICTCDFTLIGEELFAASAYLTREPVQLGSLYGQDRVKLILMILLGLGVLSATYNAAVLALGWSSVAVPEIAGLLFYKLW